MFVDRDRASRQCIAKPRLVDLPEPGPYSDRIIFVYYPFGLHREDPVQVAPAGAPKRRALLFRRHAELLVELPDIPFPQEGIGSFHRRDAGQPQLLWQAPLPGPETPLRPAARLRRVSRNHRHPQLLHRPPHLRQAVLIHLFTLLRRDEEMAAPVAVNAQNRPLLSITSRRPAITVRVDSSS